MSDIFTHSWERTESNRSYTRHRCSECGATAMTTAAGWIMGDGAEVCPASVKRHAESLLETIDTDE